ncbi:unnamed protein product, partial [Rotaria sordida]
MISSRKNASLIYSYGL